MLSSSVNASPISSKSVDSPPSPTQSNTWLLSALAVTAVASVGFGVLAGIRFFSDPGSIAFAASMATSLAIFVAAVGTISCLCFKHYDRRDASVVNESGAAFPSEREVAQGTESEPLDKVPNQDFLFKDLVCTTPLKFCDGHLVTCSKDQKIRLWTPDSEKVTRTYEIPGIQPGARLGQVALSGQHVAVVVDGTVRLFEDNNGLQLLFEVPLATNDSPDISLTIDDGYLFIGRSVDRVVSPREPKVYLNCCTIEMWSIADKARKFQYHDEMRSLRGMYWNKKALACVLASPSHKQMIALIKPNGEVAKNIVSPSQIDCIPGLMARQDERGLTLFFESKNVNLFRRDHLIKPLAFNGQNFALFDAKKQKVEVWAVQEKQLVREFEVKPGFHPSQAQFLHSILYAIWVPINRKSTTFQLESTIVN